MKMADMYSEEELVSFTCPQCLTKQKNIIDILLEGWDIHVGAGVSAPAPLYPSDDYSEIVMHICPFCQNFLWLDVYSGRTSRMTVEQFSTHVPKEYFVELREILLAIAKIDAVKVISKPRLN